MCRRACLTFPVYGALNWRGGPFCDAFVALTRVVVKISDASHSHDTIHQYYSNGVRVCFSRETMTAGVFIGRPVLSSEDTNECSKQPLI